MGEYDFQRCHIILVFKISSSHQQKWPRYANKQESISHTQKTKQLILLSLRNLLDNDFKTAILSMFKELKESMYT